ncbi:cation:proton antiporter domain-containing protein [Pararhodobacter marinus]|uniref:cation:proton antiporter domain-containing protein n=1 Tax=Pararhodobacter marinus TaxID=2184063 RepID=UPI003513D022
MSDFLILAFLFLAAGVAAVPLASLAGLGSVLGYLIAGIALSPVLTLLEVDVVSIQHFAEFGVVMMLFLVGLELEPKRLWALRNRLMGLGGLQVAGTTALIFAVLVLFGMDMRIALAIGLILAMSSTAIVLQTLNEKGLMRGDGGQASFSVLLFQDIAVIPILALIPLLAMPGAHHPHGGEEHGASLSIVADMAGWQVALVTAGAIALVVAGGMFLTRPVFRYIAHARLREIFVATALAFVVGIALLMTMVGLSPALGTFLAGVVLANSEYRHELESDIDPFRGLLLGLFFMTVGAAINFGLLWDELFFILGATVAVMVAKAAVLMALAMVFRVRGADKYLFGLGLAQAGEFGFVLTSFAVSSFVLPDDIAPRLTLIITLSMMLTPGMFILYDRLIQPRFHRPVERDADEITPKGQAIIAGHGRFGGIVNRMLLAAGYQTTVLDHSAAQLDMLRTYGVQAFFGDASRPDLLHAAGIAEAKLLVVAIDDKDQAEAIVHHVHQTYPHVHIIARAMDRRHVYRLYSAGCRDIIRDTFDSSVRTGRSALEALGMHPFQAERTARAFVSADRHALYELAQLWKPDVPDTQNEAYVKMARTLMTDTVLGAPMGAYHERSTRGWTPPTPDDTKADAVRSDG